MKIWEEYKMNRQIDARGELCPKPVIMTKKELDTMEGGTLTTIVDNEVAKDNISKLAGSYGYSFTVDKSKEGHYYINITKGQSKLEQSKVCIPDTFKDLTIAIGSDKMGTGQDELGHILMKSFIYTVRETEPLPKAIVLFNSGVRIVCEESQIVDDLKEMHKLGVEILVCGTCLDYYNLKEEIRVGEIANMYSIYEEMRNSNNTINLG